MTIKRNKNSRYNLLETLFPSLEKPPKHTKFIRRRNGTFHTEKVVICSESAHSVRQWVYIVICTVYSGFTRVFIYLV